MKLFPIYLMVSALTVASPGPGVVMTLTNGLRYGARKALPGILGLAAGIVFIAAISTTGLGLFITKSPLAFTLFKFAGAAFLIYLGVRLWLAPPFQFGQVEAHDANWMRRFLEAFTLQFSNPKAIVFCLFVFPHFIEPEENYFLQFSILTSTYALLILVIHLVYAMIAARVRKRLSSPRGGKLLNAISGTAFIVFGVMLAFLQGSSSLIANTE